MKITKNSTERKGHSNLSKALDHVKCAIDLLGPSAKTDSVAKEALINLGVIAVELNSTNSPRR